jgi:hypothetical protein
MCVAQTLNTLLTETCVFDFTMFTQAEPGTACAECKSRDPRSGWRKSKLKAGNPLMCSKCSMAEVGSRACVFTCTGIPLVLAQMKI